MDKINKRIFFQKNIIKLFYKKIMQKLFQKKYDYLSYVKLAIDRCINCRNHEQVHTRITMEYEGSLNSGPICRKCYATNKGQRIAQF